MKVANFSQYGRQALHGMGKGGNLLVDTPLGCNGIVQTKSVAANGDNEIVII